MTSEQDRAVWWALGFSLVTVAALAALTWMLWLMHGISYGAARALGWDLDIASPDTGAYQRAFALGAVVTLGGAGLLAWLTRRTPARRWPPSVSGLGAALVAGLSGISSLLLACGINPVDFLLAFR